MKQMNLMKKITALMSVVAIFAAGDAAEKKCGGRKCHEPAVVRKYCKKNKK